MGPISRLDNKGIGGEGWGIALDPFFMLSWFTKLSIVFVMSFIDGKSIGAMNGCSGGFGKRKGEIEGQG